MTPEGNAPPTIRSASQNFTAQSQLSQSTHQGESQQGWRSVDNPKPNCTQPCQQPSSCCQNQTLIGFQTTESPESTSSQAEGMHSSSLLKSGQAEAICETSSNGEINLMKETRPKVNYQSQHSSYASCLISIFWAVEINNSTLMSSIIIQMHESKISFPNALF